MIPNIQAQENNPSPFATLDAQTGELPPDSDEALTGDVIIPVENEQDVIYTVVSIFAQLLNSFGGGVLVGALTFAGILKMIQKDVALQTSIERLAVSLPPEVIQTLNAGFGYVRDIGEVGVAITDGKPNTPLGDDPPPEPPNPKTT
ncbi:MAG: hypothetical protein CUN57_00360 [Phototrophicales bacterium]|nr:MAG: hypothetical protein CUN57_00360 [Phototrophicales bacterium]